MDFIFTKSGQMMVDSVIRAANAIEKKLSAHQYSVFCSKDEAHDVIRKNVQEGNNFVNLYKDEEYCTIIFEGVEK